ncbi:HNH endonuclease [bacterium]|nr:HNH endonuclease [bacterium]
MCHVTGCDRVSTYKKKDLCQMHYFRFMRTGSFELIDKVELSHVTSNGYTVVHRPEHPLARGTGYILQHREVLYNSIGENAPDCALCGCETSWEIYKYHVDHVDENRGNNDLSNLRMLCNSCNVGRTKRVHHKVDGYIAVTISGETKTPQEWSRVDGVVVSGATIRRRLAKGLSHYDSVYGKRLTHNSKD